MTITIKVFSYITSFMIYFTYADETIMEIDLENQLDILIANCIKAIGRQHFINGRPLIITSHLRLDWQTKNNLEDILLEEFHDNLIWPMFISQPAQSNVEKELTTDKYEKIHNYILVLDYQYQEYNKTINDFRQQIQQLKSYRAWYSRGIYIVTMKVSVPQAEVEDLVKMVLKEAWLSYIYNIIVLIPIANCNRTEDIEIYTWFPYQKASGYCGILEEVVLLDKCMRTKDEVKFLENKPLFPDKVPNDLQGCPLSSITYTFEPYIQTKDKIWNGTIIGGSEIKLMQCIAKHVNATLQISTTVDSTSWRELRENLANRSVDAMFAAQLISLIDFELFEGTSVYHSERFTWTVQRADMYPKWKGITRVFTPANWALQFLTIALVSLFITILFRIRYANTGEFWNLSKSLLSMWAVYLGDGSPNEPKDLIVRLFFLTWVFQAFALNTVFQAFFTSYQIDPGRQHQISNYDEFRASKPIYVYPLQLEMFFTSKVLKSMKPSYNCFAEECLEYIAKHERSGMFCGREFFKYNIDQTVKRLHGHELYTLNSDLAQHSFVFYTQKRFPLFPRINSIVERIFQAGLYKYWVDNIIEIKLIEAGIVKLEVMDEFVTLSLEHLQGACMFFIFGISISFLLFLCEFCVYSVQRLLRKHK